MGDTLRASCYSSISPLTKTAIAAEFNHQYSRNETTLTFGAQHAIFPVTLVKARASSDGTLGALIQQQLFSSFFLTIAGDVDTRASDNRKISKLGMSLAFRPQIETKNRELFSQHGAQQYLQQTKLLPLLVSLQKYCHLSNCGQQNYYLFSSAGGMMRLERFYA